MRLAILIGALCGATCSAESILEANWSDTPIPLFLNSSSTTFELQKEGTDFLRRLGNTPISLISVGGQARAGKSFLLNNLMGSEHCTNPPCAGRGFAVGSTFESCTRGVWLWGRPMFKRDSATGERFAVIYMDTEGLGAIGNVRDNQDPKLALFASLFSSSFYYVVHRVISQEAVDFLHSVAVFSNKVQRDVSGQGALAKSFATKNDEFAFSSLFWVVQSAELCDSAAAGDHGGAVEGRARCAEQMVARALQPKSTGDAPAEVVQRYNDVVELVTTRFAPITDDGPRAMAMAHPKPFACPDEALGTVQVSKCRKLRSDELPRVPFASLDADYKAQVLALREVMQRRASPKRIMGQAGALTGTSFARLSERVLAYFNTFNGTVDRGILAEFADAAAEEALSVFEATLVGAVEQALLARDAGDTGQPSKLPEFITSALEALTARLNRNEPDRIVMHGAVDTQARSNSASHRVSSATNPRNSIDMEELEAACTVAHATAMQHFDGDRSHDRSHSDGNRFRKAARQRLEADIAAATARMRIANRAAAHQHCEHELTHSFVATVGQRALGVGILDAASASSKTTPFRSHAEYEAAKENFKQKWHHQCALPADEKYAMWARFADTQLALHDTIAAREAGRYALRGLRSTILRLAVAMVGASVATAWTPGCPQSLHSAVVFARGVLVGAALVVTAVDLQLAPELLDDVALEKFAASAAPMLSRIEVAIDDVASREARVRHAIVQCMQEQDSGVGQSVGSGGSALQHFVAILVEALVVVLVTKRAAPTWRQMRVRTLARQRERSCRAAARAAHAATAAAGAAENAAREALDAVAIPTPKSKVTGKTVLSHLTAFKPSRTLARSPAIQHLSRSTHLPALEHVAMVTANVHTPASCAKRCTTAKASKQRLQLPKRSAGYKDSSQSFSPSPLGDATNIQRVSQESACTVSPALRAFRRTECARIVTSSTNTARYSQNLG